MFWLSWPADSPAVTQPYGVNWAFDYSKWGLDGHEGIDIRAPRGSPIYAAASGIVAAAYSGGNYGTQVRIKHEKGGQEYETIYAHLLSSIVEVGQVVARGQVIGWADSTGNSTASHLHLTLKRRGATAEGETTQPNDIVDPTPYLVAPRFPSVYRPNHELTGLHDGAGWMRENGRKGWAVEVVYSEDGFHNAPTIDYRASEAAGVRVIVRLNYSYARHDGGRGTYPPAANRVRFIQWCVETIRKSHGVWGWVIGNEPNNKNEWPSDNEPITPEIVADVTNRVWWGVRVQDRISPPALDPTNGLSFDPLRYWRDVVAELVPVEFFALHAYGYWWSQPVDSSQRFGPPMQWQYYSPRMWEPLAAGLYSYRRAGQHPFRRAPIVITEADHIYKNEYGGELGWNHEHGGAWYRSLVEYIRRWNAGYGDQFVHCVVAYRKWQGDAWDVPPSVLAEIGN